MKSIRHCFFTKRLPLTVQMGCASPQEAPWLPRFSEERGASVWRFHSSCRLPLVLFGDTCLPLSCTVMSRPGITAAPDGAWMPECSLSSGQQDRSQPGAAGQERARGCRTGTSMGLQSRWPRWAPWRGCPGQQGHGSQGPGLSNRH